MSFMFLVVSLSRCLLGPHLYDRAQYTLPMTGCWHSRIFGGQSLTVPSISTSLLGRKERSFVRHAACLVRHSESQNHMREQWYLEAVCNECLALYIISRSWFSASEYVE